MTSAWAGSPKTWSAGDLSATEMNAEIRDRLDWVKAALLYHGIDSDTVLGTLKSAAYDCSVYRSSNQALVTATNTTITFPSEYKDPQSMHSTVTNTTRITIPSGGDGDYLVGYTAKIEADGSGDRVAQVAVNGTIVDWGEQSVATASASNDTSLTTSTLWPDAVAGDYLTLVVRQGSGGNVPLVYANLWVVRVASA